MAAIGAVGYHEPSATNRASGIAGAGESKAKSISGYRSAMACATITEPL
jgi:hypothetical protein